MGWEEEVRERQREEERWRKWGGGPINSVIEGVIEKRKSAVWREWWNNRMIVLYSCEGYGARVKEVMRDRGRYDIQRGGALILLTHRGLVHIDAQKEDWKPQHGHHRHNGGLHSSGAHLSYKSYLRPSGFWFHLRFTHFSPPVKLLKPWNWMSLCKCSSSVLNLTLILLGY